MEPTTTVLAAVALALLGAAWQSRRAGNDARDTALLAGSAGGLGVLSALLAID